MPLSPVKVIAESIEVRKSENRFARIRLGVPECEETWRFIERKLYCALEAPPLPQASAWLEHYGRFWELRLDKLEEFLVGKHQNSAATVLGDRT